MQKFLNWNDFAVTTPGTFGNVWTHLWLSPLGGGVCSWHLVGRGQGRCYLTSVPHHHELFALIKLSSSVTGTLSCLSTSHSSSLTEPDFLSPPHLYDMDWASSGQWAATITLWRSTWLDMGTDAHRVAQQNPAHSSLPPPHVHLFLSTGQQQPQTTSRCLAENLHKEQLPVASFSPLMDVGGGMCLTSQAGLLVSPLILQLPLWPSLPWLLR